MGYLMKVPSNFMLRATMHETNPNQSWSNNSKMKLKFENSGSRRICLPVQDPQNIRMLVLPTKVDRRLKRPWPLMFHCSISGRSQLLTSLATFLFKPETNPNQRCSKTQKPIFVCLFDLVYLDLPSISECLDVSFYTIFKPLRKIR